MKKKPSENKIYYSQSWEDFDIVRSVLNFDKNDTVLAISSGGDNVLGILSFSPSKIFSIDSSSAQNHLLRLKICAISNLEYKDLIGFFGVSDNFKRKKTYKKIRKYLNIDTRKFWDDNLDMVEAGLIHCGKFEKYNRFFINNVLPLVNSKNKTQKLFSIDKIDKQYYFYKKNWDNLRWKFLIYFFSNRNILNRYGRSKNMKQDKSFRAFKHYYSKLDNLFKTQSIIKNHYLHYLFNGFYKKDHLPFYLRKENYEKIKSNIDKIVVIDSSAEEFSKSDCIKEVNKIYLSNIFDSLPKKDSDSVFFNINRNSPTDTKIIFWNHRIDVSVPEACLRLSYKKDESIRLKNQDRVFFYKQPNVYEVI